MLLLIGNGKGKTTSAIGQAIRVLGQGQQVAFFQFIKSKSWPTGEEKILRKFKQLKFYKGGLGFVGIMGDSLPFAKHKQAAQQTFTLVVQAITSKKYQLVVLDEVNVALQLKLITLKQVLTLIKKLPRSVDVLLTGRGAPKQLIAAAELVSEVKEIKHPYNKGLVGRRAREY